LYSSPSVISIITDEVGGVCSTKRDEKNVYWLLVIKAEGQRPLGPPRRRWVDNIKIVLGEIEWSSLDWICLAQDRKRALVNAVMSFRVP
jgi:hypothetical protein